MRVWFNTGRLAVAASAAFVVGAAGTQGALRVPTVAGPPVLVDGRFSPGEWDGARGVPIAPGDTLLLRQARGHVFIGVRTARPYPTYVDLFLRDGEGRVYNLHASMQTGERELTGAEWTDTRPATRWGNEDGWIANVSKRVPERLQDRTMPAPKEFFFPSQGREFQILRSRFRGERWSVRVEVRDLGGGGAPDVVYPAGSSREAPAGWAVLELGEQGGAGATRPGRGGGRGSGG